MIHKAGTFILGEFRLIPKAEPSEVSVCAGCGDAILDGEEFRTFEGGRRIHDHPDCKVALVDKMLGITKGT